jgi:excisionase family DNA binding protein
MTQQRAFVCGTTTLDGDAGEWDGVLTPQMFGFEDRREPYTPKEIAAHLYTSSDTVIRMIEEGIIVGLRLRGSTYRIPYIAIAHYFARMTGAMN